MSKRLFDLPEVQRKQKETEDKILELKDILDQKINKINEQDLQIQNLNRQVLELTEKVNVLEQLDVEVQSLKQCAHEKLGALQTQVEQLKLQ